MDDFERFVDDLITSLQGEPPFIRCSRVELATEQSTQSVIVLLRTEPSLSSELLEAPEFQYPGACLLNTALVISSVFEYIQKKVVALAASELAQAVLGDARTTVYEGVSFDDRTGVLRVPVVQPDITALSSEWGRVLHDSPYPFQGGKGAGDISLYIFHVPDVPMGRLSQAEKLKVVTMSRGWNFMPVFEESLHRRLAAVVEYASKNGHVIRTY